MHFYIRSLQNEHNPKPVRHNFRQFSLFYFILALNYVLNINTDTHVVVN